MQHREQRRAEARKILSTTVVEYESSISCYHHPHLSAMAFHFPGSAPRPQRRVSFDNKKDDKAEKSFKVENPLLNRAPAPAQPSTPQQPSPFINNMSTPAATTGGLVLNTPTPGLRQRTPQNGGADGTAATGPKPPPMASYSWGASAVPSLRDESPRAPLGSTPVRSQRGKEFSQTIHHYCFLFS